MNIIERLMPTSQHKQQRNISIENIVRQFWRTVERNGISIALVGSNRAIKKLTKQCHHEQLNNVRYTVTPRRFKTIIQKLHNKATKDLTVNYIVVPDQPRKKKIALSIRKQCDLPIPVIVLFDDILAFLDDFLDIAGLEEKPEYPAAKSYVIASSRRTGSTMLRSMLLKTKKLGKPREYIREPIITLAEHDFIKIGPLLTNIIHHVRSPNGVFGITTHWSALELFKTRVYPSLSGKEKAIIDDLYKNSTYIYLKRNNKLRQAVSDWRAVNTKVFSLHKNDNQREKELSRKKLDYNYCQILIHLKNCIREEQEWQIFFRHNRIVPLETSYEEIVQSPQAVINSIAQTLGIDLENPIIAPTTIKLADKYTEFIYNRFTGDLEQEYGTTVVDKLKGLHQLDPSIQPICRQPVCKPKKHVLVTMATENYLDMAKQLFASAYYNGGWDGDYFLLAHEIPEEKLTWFKERGIKIKHCKSLYQGKPGGMSACLASKFYMFTPYFKQWRTVIYSDADAIVRGPLEELKFVSGFHSVEDWSPTLMEQIVSDSDIEKRVLQREQYKTILKKSRKRFNLSRRPFCAGFFAFSTDIIEDHSFESLKNTMDTYHPISKFGDQLSFNFYFYDKWKKLKPTFNVLVRQEYDHNPLHNYFSPSTRWGVVGEVSAYILHIFDPKPWSKRSNYYLEWLSNLKKAETIDLKNIPKTNPQRLVDIKKTERQIRLQMQIYAIVEYFGPYKSSIIRIIHFFYWKLYFFRRVKWFLSAKIKVTNLEQ